MNEGLWKEFQNLPRWALQDYMGLAFISYSCADQATDSDPKSFGINID